MAWNDRLLARWSALLACDEGEWRRVFDGVASNGGGAFLRLVESPVASPGVIARAWYTLLAPTLRELPFPGTQLPERFMSVMPSLKGIDLKKVAPFVADLVQASSDAITEVGADALEMQRMRRFVNGKARVELLARGIDIERVGAEFDATDDWGAKDAQFSAMRELLRHPDVLHFWKSRFDARVRRRISGTKDIEAYAPFHAYVAMVQYFLDGALPYGPAILIDQLHFIAKMSERAKVRPPWRPEPLEHAVQIIGRIRRGNLRMLDGVEVYNGAGTVTVDLEYLERLYTEHYADAVTARDVRRELAGRKRSA